MVYKNRDMFEGEFDCSLRGNKGKMMYANGDVYDGDWLNEGT
jgi:hypothetical protein